MSGKIVLGMLMELSRQFTCSTVRVMQMKSLKIENISEHLTGQHRLTGLQTISALFSTFLSKIFVTDPLYLFAVDLHSTGQG